MRVLLLSDLIRRIAGLLTDEDESDQQELELLSITGAERRYSLRQRISEIYDDIILHLYAERPDKSMLWLKE
jgi:hypothetical protein